MLQNLHETIQQVDPFASGIYMQVQFQAESPVASEVGGFYSQANFTAGGVESKSPA